MIVVVVVVCLFFFLLACFCTPNNTSFRGFIKINFIIAILKESIHEGLRERDKELGNKRDWGLGIVDCGRELRNATVCLA